MSDKNEQKEHYLLRTFASLILNIVLMSFCLGFAIDYILDYKVEMGKLIVGTTVVLMYLHKPSDKKTVNYYNMSIDRMAFNATGIVILTLVILGRDMCGIF